jgi:murein DD-endopeptidase MepM/ murein hydrolase activator NlpD
MRFGLTLRTLYCANPNYKPGDHRITLPLTAARRHWVQAGQTLGQIANLYGVAPETITAFPLNFWQGCAGVPGLGPEEAKTELPVGVLLFVPDEPVSFTLNKNGTLLSFGGRQIQNQSREGLVEVIDNPVLTISTTAITVRPAEATATPVPTTVPPTATPTPMPGLARGGGSPVTYLTPVPTATKAPTQTANTNQGVKPAAGAPLIWPMRGLITTNFSAAHPAIDIATANGTPIVAAQSGLVYYASWSPYGYGNFVQIEHGDGRQTHYAHLRAFNVKPGDFVQQGQLIGWEGSTGNSTGPHLHFELVIQGRYVDPLLYLPTK